PGPPGPPRRRDRPRAPVHRRAPPAAGAAAGGPGRSAPPRRLALRYRAGMRAAAFFDPAARAAARKAIEDIEAQTEAEIVVAVHPRSGSYQATDFLVGLVVAEIALLLVLFLPQEFWLETIPLDVACGFALGAVASSRLPPLRRLFTRERRRARHVTDAA